MKRLLPIASVLLINATTAQPLSKGQRILIERGLQLQGMVTKDDVFHLNTYQDIGYTSIDWLGASDMSKTGPAPGFLWSRWAMDESAMPPKPGEAEFMSQCIGLSLADERFLGKPDVRDTAVKWFDSVRDNPAYANTLLYTNNYGGQADDAALGDFIARAKPDMLMFDLYPFRCDWTAAHDGKVKGADVTPWYAELRRYREHARQHDLPLAVYMQTFHAIQDYDHTVYRDPSPSELRLNNMAAVAFNAKWLTGFTYNSGASSLFVKPGGDTNHSSLYNDQKLVNKHLKNWGNTLVRLKPIDDWTTNFTTTGMLFIRGKHYDAASDSDVLNGIPTSFAFDNRDPHSGFSEWEADKNDPYLRGWSITNLGSKNINPKTGEKLPGDVIVSWFKPLESQAPQGSSEVYVMIVNGLTDPTGLASDCTQAMRFNFLSNLTAVQMLDPETGKVVSTPLPFNPETQKRRSLDLKLSGGDAVLFKFDTGAPFVGVP